MDLCRWSARASSAGALACASPLRGSPHRPLRQKAPSPPSTDPYLRVRPKRALRISNAGARARRCGFLAPDGTFRHAGRRRRAPRAQAREQLAVKVDSERSSSHLRLHIGEPADALSRFPEGRRARVSSEGAAAASAAARPHGAASRKATLQARAPEEDTHARLTGKNQSHARHGRRHNEKLTAKRNPRARS